nr:hypothetical protein [Deltaproteobacteria bacterium]
MFELLFALGNDSSRESELVDGLNAHTARVRASLGGGDRAWVSAAEDEVAADPAGTISFDGRGRATVHALGRTWAAGRFEIPTIGSLRDRASRRALRVEAGPHRLWVLDGEGVATDIGALQAHAPEGALFQAASQFNCLESPGAYVTSVAAYLGDPTQGPRASISAFPATLVRHYAAPSKDGRRFTQSTHGEQIDLLADVCSPQVARVESGYLRDRSIFDAGAFAEALQARFDEVRVGLHDDVEVVLGAHWDGAVATPHRIAQVFTSTLAGGMYSSLATPGEAYRAITRQLLRAAYLGTLLGAIAVGRRVVVLTLIGGGVFGNPIELIWESILWAMEESARVAPVALDVVVNGRALAQSIERSELAGEAARRGGVMVELGRAGGAVVVR